MLGTPEQFESAPQIKPYEKDKAEREENAWQLGQTSIFFKA